MADLQDVEVAIAVVIENGDAAGRDFGRLILPVGPRAGRVFNSGGFGDFGEENAGRARGKDARARRGWRRALGFWRAG
jgi:hypothetical protein